MHIQDFYPSRGSYSPGETVEFFVELESSAVQAVTLQVHVQHLFERSIVLDQTVRLDAGHQTVKVIWTPPAQPAGYSARLEIYQDDARVASASTSFDVLSNWTDFPRYGFLSDFSASRSDPELTIKKLVRFHINGLQFYDWQYRHDRLLAPADSYIDPLGREMSLGSVRQLVDVAHQHGMASLPYLAIYAASADFWRAHPEWALYDESGKAIAFGENFLGLMDPTSGSPWSQHLLAEGTRTLQTIPFDGLHIDQYGDPKIAWNADHGLVELPQAFVDFIQAASDQHPEQVILFNAVGNWPIENLTASAVDFMYIEVWPPDVEYQRLAEIVLHATQRSQGKAVVIALYLPANRPANNLLADAVILACGGNRIELGEEARLLSDPYFPKHEELSPELYSGLRQLSGFSVRNGEWLRPYTLSSMQKHIWAQGELNAEFISTIDSVWTVTRKYPNSLTVQFVNFNGLDTHQRWDEAHALPGPCENIPVRIQTSQRPSQIVWDTPENNEGLQSLTFEYKDGVVIFEIPQIQLTGLVSIHE